MSVTAFSFQWHWNRPVRTYVLGVAPLSPASLAEPCLQAMEQMQVIVPAGVGPGQAFQVNTPGGPMQVVCPPDASAGKPMMVNVPAAQPVAVAMAQSMPIAMAEPMQMGMPPQPMQMGMAPQPMQMGMAAPQLLNANRKVLQLAIDLGGGCEDHSPPMQAPQELTGLNSGDWGFIKEKIDEHQSSNGFKTCPCLETAICCTCCCACTMLPCFLTIGNYTKREEKMKKQTIHDINAKLLPYGMRAEFASGATGESLTFYAQ